MQHAFQPTSLELVLPWEIDEQQDARFKKWLIRVVAPFLLLLIVIPLLPELELTLDDTAEEVVKTRILLEPKIVEQPKPEPQKVVEQPKPKPKPEKVKPVEQKKVTGTPVPPAPPKTEQETKQDFAKAQGLSGLSNELSSLRNSLDLKKLQTKNVSHSDAGRVEHSANQVLGKDSATMVGTGISVDDADMRSDAIALAEHNSLIVEGVSTAGGEQSGRSHSSAYGSYTAGMRDMESIRRVLERTKSRTQSDYQRFLRDHPDLGGKFIFKFVIQPDGELTDLELVASELGVANLEQSILDKIKRINFGKKDVSATSVQYSFTFLPSV
ncbi:AgmX/PglI C-terminal domain-containing protein [Saccharophagus degradans]|uniref:AgmX/PglI C-terminal domain-containing protein n=1 Tax=Saccharophagus degradans TaxID=86304 RepID=A0AAW7X463_9GAMM|nr:AgmX/PglI C-terminal domain-containing protein [Saccharophagus degradans]MDO6421672.1 AgmX/PglI C-terminal domain-containing protein [Saccharophagus degradans]MDO6608634.1 AgmX/PglI C-terminal domain-containing protein [Saccharophagus degradans]WGO99598.1 AgmX/PglI C-terminal domain-containing protein [Saccharophagus degradans]